jgi:hypothetical protein
VQEKAGKKLKARKVGESSDKSTCQFADENLGGNEYVVLIAPSYTMALSTASQVEDETSEVTNSIS